MAAVNAIISYRVVDANKVPKSIPFWMRAASGLLADFQTGGSTFATTLDAALNVAVTGADLIVPLDLSGATLKGAAVAGSNNEIGGLFNFSEPGRPATYTYWLPGLLSAGYEASHPNLIDQTQTQMSNFISAVTAVGGTLDIMGEDWAVIEALDRAVKSVRKQRRALARTR